MDKASAADAIARFYETLAPEDVARLKDFYVEDASFKDPFNEVRGVAAIAQIFRHMFVQVDNPRFVITARFGGDDGAMLLWDFHFRTRGWGAKDFCIAGASHLRFAKDGRVTAHRDYWDVAEELYAKLPVLGLLMRGLQRAGRA